MKNPCLECPSRNVVCTTDQLFMDCKPWNDFEQALLDKLMDGTILYVPRPKRKWRWLNDVVSNSTRMLGL